MYSYISILRWHRLLKSFPGVLHPYFKRKDVAVDGRATQGSTTSAVIILIYFSPKIQSQSHKDLFILHVYASATMMTSPNGNIFRITGPLWGEFTVPGEFLSQRPVTRSFDVFYDLRLNKRWSQ